MAHIYWSQKAREKYKWFLIGNWLRWTCKRSRNTSKTHISILLFNFSYSFTMCCVLLVNYRFLFLRICSALWCTKRAQNNVVQFLMYISHRWKLSPSTIRHTTQEESLCHIQEYVKAKQKTKAKHKTSTRWTKMKLQTACLSSLTSGNSWRTH